MVGAGMSAPPSPLNVEIGPNRRFSFVQADLAQFKKIKNLHGGTVNDVVLSVVTGALGNHLRARGEDTSEMELRAMVPVSVRGESEHGALGNKVSAMMAPLPVWCDDPVERLRLMTAAMGDLKSSGQAVGAQLLTQLADFAPTTIASQAARLQPQQRFFNLVVTNIPGPQIPLYVLGREMEALYPMVPLARRQALCIGIMSYNGQLNFGLIGDFDAMTELESFGLDLTAAIEDLVAASPGVKRSSQARTPASEPAAARRSNSARSSSRAAS